VPFGPVAIPRQGRLTFRVTASPTNRKLGTNLERYDPAVRKLTFNGTNVNLAPVCNAWDADPAIAVSVYDTPGAGTLSFELLGGATYNTWGEFDGALQQDYSLELLFLPGPAVTLVAPSAGAIGGDEWVSVRGSGFSPHALVLFNEVPGGDTVWADAGELQCRTPPGVPGSVRVRVLNTDSEGQNWNYGQPYGLFGDLTNGFTYLPTNAVPIVRDGERLLATARGYFPGVGYDQPARSTNLAFGIPASAGRLRFEAWAFKPILNAIAGPFEDPDNLAWHNQSSAVWSFRGGSGAPYYPAVTSTELNDPYAPVICESRQAVGTNAAGAGTLTLTGPAIWNAFYREYGEYVMESAPAQNWALAVWFAYPPTLASVTPASGLDWGGTRLTLHGEHFSSNVQVRVNGQLARDVVVLDEQTLTCLSPAGAVGPATVEIAALDMTCRATNAFAFQSSAPYATILGMDVAPLRVRVTGAQGVPYGLQRNAVRLTTNAWVDVGAPGTGAWSVLTLTDPSPPTNRALFYRLKIRP